MGISTPAFGAMKKTKSRGEERREEVFEQHSQAQAHKSLRYSRNCKWIGKLKNRDLELKKFDAY